MAHVIHETSDVTKKRLKNLFRRIEERSREYLAGHPNAGEQLSELVQPLREAQETGDVFWDAQSDGVAIFLAPGVAEDAEVRGGFDPERELLHMSDSGEGILDLAAHYAWSRGSRMERAATMPSGIGR